MIENSSKSSDGLFCFIFTTHCLQHKLFSNLCVFVFSFRGAVLSIICVLQLVCLNNSIAMCTLTTSQCKPMSCNLNLGSMTYMNLPSVSQSSTQKYLCLLSMLHSDRVEIVCSRMLGTFSNNIFKVLIILSNKTSLYFSHICAHSSKMAFVKVKDQRTNSKSLLTPRYFHCI